MANFRPNIILLHAGTNDLSLVLPTDPAGAPNRLGKLIDNLISFGNKDSVILVAQIIDVTNGEAKSLIQNYNDATPRIVAKRSMHHIAVVDFHGKLQASDYADGLHPNDNGYKKIYLYPTLGNYYCGDSEGGMPSSSALETNDSSHSAKQTQISLTTHLFRAAIVQTWSILSITSFFFSYSNMADDYVKPSLPKTPSPMKSSYANSDNVSPVTPEARFEMHYSGQLGNVSSFSPAAKEKATTLKRKHSQLLIQTPEKPNLFYAWRLGVLDSLINTNNSLIDGHKEATRDLVSTNLAHHESIKEAKESIMAAKKSIAVLENENRFCFGRDTPLKKI